MRASTSSGVRPASARPPRRSRPLIGSSVTVTFDRSPPNESRSAGRARARSRPGRSGPTTSATSRSPRESPIAMHSSGREAAAAHVRRDRVRLAGRARDQVVGVDRRRPAASGERRSVIPLSTSRRCRGRARANSSSTSAEVDLAAEQVRELAVRVPGRVVLEPAREGLEQQRAARPTRSICSWTLALGRGSNAPVRKTSSVAVHEPAAHLVDVGGLADQARVLVAPAPCAGPT